MMNDDGGNVKMLELMDEVRAANGKPHLMAEGLALSALVGFDSPKWNFGMRQRWSQSRIRDCKAAIQRSELITDEGLVEATDGWSDDVAFWLDVAVVEGLLERSE